MPKAAHKITDSLSAHAWSLMKAGFAAKKMYAAISKEIAAATGEKVSERTIGRRQNEWRAEEDRLRAVREQAVALVAAVKENNLEASSLAAALVADALASSGEVPKLSAGLAGEEIQLKKRELALKERKQALDEKKFQQQADQLDRIAKISAPGKTKDPAAAVKALQQVFGVATNAA